MLRNSLSSLLCGAASLVAVASAAELPYGTVIRSCSEPNSIALTFDDGPHPSLTPKLLKTLKDSGVKATFFINGENYGSAANEAPLLKQMLADGHQIGSHTYNHKRLTDETPDSVREQMSKLDDVLVQVIGKSPIFMRAPYFSTNAETLKVLAELKYHVIDADIDTFDWMHQKPEDSDKALQLFKDKLASGGSITLMHDVHATTVDILVPKILPLIEGKKTVTVGECLGVPQDKWYRNTTPEPKTTEAKTPEPKTPKTKTPEYKTPAESKTPEAKTPKTKTPKTKTPKTKTYENKSSTPSASVGKTMSSTVPIVTGPSVPSVGLPVKPPVLTPSMTPWTNVSRATNKPTSSVETTTSVVYTTSIQTVTSCPPSVKTCSAGGTYTSTVTVPVYTIICPVDAVATSTAQPTGTVVETRTAKVTKISTITSCPSTVANCPVGSVTTQVSSTTYCPGQQCGRPTGPAQPAAPKEESDKKTPGSPVPGSKGCSGQQCERPSGPAQPAAPKEGSDKKTPSSPVPGNKGCSGQQCERPSGPAQPATPKKESGEKTPGNPVPGNKGPESPKQGASPKMKCPSSGKGGQAPKNSGAGGQTPGQAPKNNGAGSKTPSPGGKDSGAKPSYVPGQVPGAKPSPMPGKVAGGKGRNATVSGAAKPSASAFAPTCVGGSCSSYLASKSVEQNAVTGAAAASFGIGAAPLVVGAILAML